MKQEQIQLVNFAPKGLIQDIRFAIKSRLYMNLDYNNKYSPMIGYRNIAPAAIGNNIKTGNLCLRAYLIRGVSWSTREGISQSQWRLFLVNRVSNWSVSSNTFGPLPLYRLNDRGLTGIREQLEYSANIITEIPTEDYNEADYIWI